ncbi:MAG: Uma2 family endonuclease [Acidobacteriota bacterium]|jgi:Uma2 family endonuclease
MNLATTPIKLTYEDYLEFPEDGSRHELVEGDHVVTPAPNMRHQIIQANLFRFVGSFVHDQGLGRVLSAPTDVVLSEHDVVQPDLLFVAREHLDRIGEAHLAGAPDLVVEILSEATRRRDEVLKRHLYERYGVGEYWLVDPVIEAVKVLRRSRQADQDDDAGFERLPELTAEAVDLLSSPLLPGLEIPLTEIFG